MMQSCIIFIVTVLTLGANGFNINTQESDGVKNGGLQISLGLDSVGK